MPRFSQSQTLPTPRIKPAGTANAASTLHGSSTRSTPPHPSAPPHSPTNDLLLLFPSLRYVYATTLVIHLVFLTSVLAASLQTLSHGWLGPYILINTFIYAYRPGCNLPLTSSQCQDAAFRSQQLYTLYVRYMYSVTQLFAFVVDSELEPSFAMYLLLAMTKSRCFYDELRLFS